MKLKRVLELGRFSGEHLEEHLDIHQHQSRPDSVLLVTSGTLRSLSSPPGDITSPELPLEGSVFLGCFVAASCLVHRLWLSLVHKSGSSENIREHYRLRQNITGSTMLFSIGKLISILAADVTDIIEPLCFSAKFN